MSDELRDEIAEAEQRGYERGAAELAAKVSVWAMKTARPNWAALGRILHGTPVPDDDTDCTCGYGGFHEPTNPRCERNSDDIDPSAEYLNLLRRNWPSDELREAIDRAERVQP